MNDEQLSRVEGWAIAMASFQAYLDYVVRDEIAMLLESGLIQAEPVEDVVAHLKSSVMERMAKDISEYLPQVFGDLGKRLREAASNEGKTDMQT